MTAETENIFSEYYTVDMEPTQVLEETRLEAQLLDFEDKSLSTIAAELQEYVVFRNQHLELNYNHGSIFMIIRGENLPVFPLDDKSEESDSFLRMLQAFVFSVDKFVIEKRHGGTVRKLKQYINRLEGKGWSASQILTFAQNYLEQNCPGLNVIVDEDNREIYLHSVEEENLLYAAADPLPEMVSKSV